MNKNKDNYKKTFSSFAPSDTAVEMVFEMTTDKKKKSANVAFRRIAAAALAFVFIICGGFGVNSAVNKRNAVSDRLGVMIAIAGENELLEAGKASKQDVFYGIYVADIEDDKAVADAKNRWEKDKSRIDQLAEEQENEIGIYAGSWRAGRSVLCRDENADKPAAAVYMLSTGSFLLNLFDYSNVKDITIENTSRYGELCLDFWNTGYESDEDMDAYNEALSQGNNEFGNIMESTFGRAEDKLVLTKEFLQAGTEREEGKLLIADGVVNPGYALNWDPSEYLLADIGEDVNFDLSQIQDTIIFTVNYEDGTSEQASVSLAFDSDGYMHITDAQ